MRKEILVDFLLTSISQINCTSYDYMSLEGLDARNTNVTTTLIEARYACQRHSQEIMPNVEWQVPARWRNVAGNFGGGILVSSVVMLLIVKDLGSLFEPTTCLHSELSFPEPSRPSLSAGNLRGGNFTYSILASWEFPARP